MAVPELAIERFLFPRLAISGFHGDEAYRKQTLDLVRRGVGGFVCFDGEISACAEAIREIRRQVAHPLLFAADCEFGTAMRFSGGTPFPPMMGLAVGGGGIVEDVARAIGREMNAVGLDWNLAPVLDVNTNRANPIINVRSFGEDPEAVGALGGAYVRGLAQGGVLSCGKHLPGHGDTSVDSHIGLPSLDLSPERLLNTELKPFISAIEAGVDSLMSAHLLVPALGAASEPVSLSAAGIARLRSILGFDGVMITDALDMGALERFENSDGEGVVISAFTAGNDIVELPVDPFASLEALRKACADGRISPQRRSQSSRRLQVLYERRRTMRESAEVVDDLDTLLKENRDLAERLARVVVRTSGDRLPDREQTGSWYLFCGPMDHESGGAIATALSSIPGCTPEGLPESQSGTLRKGRADLPPILILNYSPRGGAGMIGIDAAELAELGIPDGPTPWVITLGNPYLPNELQARGQLDLFSSAPSSIELLAEIVTGGYSPDGSGLS